MSHPSLGSSPDARAIEKKLGYDLDTDYKGLLPPIVGQTSSLILVLFGLTILEQVLLRPARSNYSTDSQTPHDIAQLLPKPDASIARQLTVNAAGLLRFVTASTTPRGALPPAR